MGGEPGEKQSPQTEIQDGMGKPWVKRSDGRELI